MMSYLKVDVYSCIIMYLLLLLIDDMFDYRGCTVPEGEYGYISRTLSMSVLQHLCNSFKVIIHYCIACNYTSITVLLIRQCVVRYWCYQFHISEALELTR